MLRLLVAALLVLVVGCVQIPPSPQELDAKKFESVPGKAVIYIVRPYPDLYSGHGSFALDDNLMITMFEGNFYRWVVEPGARQIVGKGPDLSRVAINAEAGKVYYVRHTVTGYRATTYGGYLQLVPERDGRALVQRATLLGGG